MTVKPLEDKWVIATRKSDQTGGLFEDNLFENKESAEAVAREYASGRGHVFVEYNTPFLSIAKIKDVYALLTITFSADVGPITTFPSFTVAVNLSVKFAAILKVPFEPHWFIERGEDRG